MVGKDIICSQAMQSNTLCIRRNRPPQSCANLHPYDSICLILGLFCQSAAMLLLKNKHYFTLSFVFSSPGDVSITAIATPATKRWTCPPACCRPQMHVSLLSRSMIPSGWNDVLIFLRMVLNLETVKLVLFSSEVALCPLLPWYCVKSSWNICFRDF